jgi:hypothetical protein
MVGETFGGRNRDSVLRVHAVCSCAYIHAASKIIFHLRDGVYSGLIPGGISAEEVRLLDHFADT